MWALSFPLKSLDHLSKLKTLAESPGCLKDSSRVLHGLGDRAYRSAYSKWLTKTDSRSDEQTCFGGCI